MPTPQRSEDSYGFGQPTVISGPVASEVRVMNEKLGK